MTIHRIGMLGRRKSDPARLARMIRLPLTGVLPAYPAVADHLSVVSNWMLGGNDRYGTCGPTSIANFLVLAYKGLLGEDITVTDADVFDLYRRSGNPTFDPTTGAGDEGVDMTVMFDALLKGGIWITHASGNRELVKPICYAAVPTDMPTQYAVTSIMGATIWGVDLQVAQQSQDVWDYVPSAEWGGHAVPGGSYTGAKRGTDESVVSWKEVIGSTDAFSAHQLTESYVAIFPIQWDHPAFQAGVDQAQLAADYEAVTGQPFPVPVTPPPGPGPQPPPPTPSGGPNLLEIVLTAFGIALAVFLAIHFLL